MTDAFAARATPRRGKGSRSQHALYERGLAAITKRQKDLEYRAARNPGKIADDALEALPRVESCSDLWARFSSMVGSDGLP